MDEFYRRRKLLAVHFAILAIGSADVDLYSDFPLIHVLKTVTTGVLATVFGYQAWNLNDLLDTRSTFPLRTAAAALTLSLITIDILQIVLVIATLPQCRKLQGLYPEPNSPEIGISRPEPCK